MKLQILVTLQKFKSKGELNKNKIHLKISHNTDIDLNKVKPEPIIDREIKKGFMVVETCPIGVHIYNDDEFDWFFLEDTGINIQWTGENNLFDAIYNEEKFKLLIIKKEL